MVQKSELKIVQSSIFNNKNLMDSSSPPGAQTTQKRTMLVEENPNSTFQDLEAKSVRSSTALL
jgi:hypothetical protein